MKTIAAIVAVVVLGLGVPAAAADFPNRPVRILVPFGAGGSTDVMTRVLAAEMSKVLGQSVLTINKAGAGGTVGAAEVAAAQPDGYLLGMLPVGPLTTQTNLLRLSYGPESFDYLCLVYSNPQVLIVRKDAPFKTLGDLAAYAKQNPGKVNYGSTGVGSIPHLAALAVAKGLGIDVFHVPYKGDSDQLAGLLGGSIAMFVTHPTLVKSHAERVRALVALGPSRLKDYPDLPTAAEQGAGPLSFNVWGGLATARGTPRAAAAVLENACKQSMASETFREQMEKLHTAIDYRDGKAFQSFVIGEFKRNERLLRESGVEKQ